MWVIFTAHYKQYFKLVDGEATNMQEVVFDTNGLRNAYKSFLDSIVLELLLPDTKFPREILFGLLHESIKEAPKETKRFPQELYATLGDLSVRDSLPIVSFVRYMCSSRSCPGFWPC
jgi:hypothetical protein